MTNKIYISRHSASQVCEMYLTDKDKALKKTINMDQSYILNLEILELASENYETIDIRLGMYQFTPQSESVPDPSDLKV